MSSSAHCSTPVQTKQPPAIMQRAKEMFKPTGMFNMLKDSARVFVTRVAHACVTHTGTRSGHIAHPHRVFGRVSPSPSPIAIPVASPSGVGMVSSLGLRFSPSAQLIPTSLLTVWATTQATLTADVPSPVSTTSDSSWSIVDRPSCRSQVSANVSEHNVARQSRVERVSTLSATLSATLVQPESPTSPQFPGTCNSSSSGSSGSSSRNGSSGATSSTAVTSDMGDNDYKVFSRCVVALDAPSSESYDEVIYVAPVLEDDQAVQDVHVIDNSDSDSSLCSTKPKLISVTPSSVPFPSVPSSSPPSCSVPSSSVPFPSVPFPSVPSSSEPSSSVSSSSATIVEAGPGLVHYSDSDSDSDSECEMYNTVITDGRMAFALFGVLGRGGGGRVMLGLGDDGRRVAIKVIHKMHQYRFKQGREHLLVEKYVMERAKLRRSLFLTTLLRSWEDTDNVYFVMPYSPENLRTRLRGVAEMDPKEARIYCAEMLYALHELHSLNIMHRDIKPENVLIDREGHLSLCDFGLAYVPRIHTRPLSKCRTFSVVGTPGYLAPEVVAPDVYMRGYKYNVDIYALGLVFVELLAVSKLCGVPYLNATSVEAQVKAMEERERNRDLDWLIDDENARDLVSLMLEQDPNLRPLTDDLMNHPYFMGVDWELVKWHGYERSHRPQYQIPANTDTRLTFSTFHKALDSSYRDFGRDAKGMLVPSEQMVARLLIGADDDFIYPYC